MIMKHFAVLCEDGGKAYSPSFRQSNAFHLSHNFLLNAADADALAGNGVHLLPENPGSIQFHDFLRGLYQPHADDGAYQSFGRFINSEALQFKGIIISGWWYRVDGTSLDNGLGYGPIEFRVGSAMRHTHEGGLFCHRRLGAHPDYVIDADIIGINGLRTGVQIENCGKSRFVDPEIIEPGAVLAEFITIVFVLGRSLDIADENGNTLFAFQKRAKLFTPG